MRGSAAQFLETLARRGSKYGGGSVAALTAAAACALLEKLITAKPASAKLRRLRLQCLKLVEQDAATFAAAMSALRSGKRSLFAGRLKKAIEVPFQVFSAAHQARALGLAQRQKISKLFKSDWRCAMALADASIAGAQAFVDANLSWLNDKRYAQHMRKRLKAAKHPYAGRR